MGKLKELKEQPVVFVNDIKYVPEKLFKEYLAQKLEVEKTDCNNQDEQDGIDIAIQCIMNS